MVLPGGVQLRQSVLKGTGTGHGEVVAEGNVQLLALLNQTVQGVVPVGVGVDDVVVEHQVVAGPVAHQDVAVAVQNVSPGGADGGDGGVGLLVVGVAFCFNDLQGKELAGEEHQDKGEEHKQQNSTKTAYSFHVLPPIRPILQIRE